jgi:hypothetical protein
VEPIFTKNLHLVEYPATEGGRQSLLPVSMLSRLIIIFNHYLLFISSTYFEPLCPPLLKTTQQASMEPPPVSRTGQEEPDSCLNHCGRWDRLW